MGCVGCVSQLKAAIHLDFIRVNQVGNVTQPQTEILFPESGPCTENIALWMCSIKRGTGASYRTRRRLCGLVAT